MKKTKKKIKQATRVLPRFCRDCGKEVIRHLLPSGYDEYTGKKLFQVWYACPSVDTIDRNSTYMHTVDYIESLSESEIKN